MANAAILVDAFPQFFDSNGNPLAGGTLSFSGAGGNVPLSVYSDPTLTTPLTNPVTLDSAGRPATSIYTQPAAYKIVLKDAAGTTIRTADNVSDIRQLIRDQLAPTHQTQFSSGSLIDFQLDGAEGATGVGVNFTYATLVLNSQNAAPAEFHGFSPGVLGQRLVVVNIGSAPITFVNESVSSLPVNRIIGLQQTSRIGVGGIAEFVYSQPGRWRMVASQFGTAIDYSVVWTGAVSNPAIGNGAISARYYMSGRVVFVDIVLTAGSTTTFGSGYWTFSLPVPAYAPIGQATGNAVVHDAGGNYFHLATLMTGASQFLVQQDGTAFQMGPTVPMTWGNGDAVAISLWYLAA